ncbi:nitrilase-related carbon-nitrogen hydrolase [Arthrobacter globiformis]|uniref:nitrilase-related carbon-nitrogen hydrolase n=1 Tax=Arthrobacter globiformis TaxID=1665 RepID=UPI00345EA6CB
MWPCAGISGLLWIWSGLAEEKKERFRYVLRPVDRSGLPQQVAVDGAWTACQRFVMPAGNARIAAIQATPVILDAEATVAKAVRLLGEASAQGVKLAVFPETFLPLYPSGVWAHQAAPVRRIR